MPFKLAVSHRRRVVLTIAMLHLVNLATFIAWVVTWVYYPRHLNHVYSTAPEIRAKENQINDKNSRIIVTVVGVNISCVFNLIDGRTSYVLVRDTGPSQSRSMAFKHYPVWARSLVFCCLKFAVDMGFFVFSMLWSLK